MRQVNQVINTRTQKEYNMLMEMLENREYLFYNGKKPTEISIWNLNKEQTCINLENNLIYFSKKSIYQGSYEIILFQKYMKQKFEDKDTAKIIKDFLVHNLTNPSEKTNQMGKKMQTLSNKLKRLFNKELQTLYKAGYIDECGDLTEEGKEELDFILRDENMEKLVASAESKIKEEKNEQNK